MEIQPEVKVKSREREGERRRERERHGGSQSPKKPGRETSSRNWPPSFIVQKAFYTFDKTRRSMGNTKLCSVRNPDSFRISFCIQKVSGDLHYLLAKRLVNTFWLSSLMNVNFVSPEVFFFFFLICISLKH